MKESDNSNSCSLETGPDLSNLTIIELKPVEITEDYRIALRLAAEEVGTMPGDYMLLSWYDRDRDFESPQHSSECHQDSAVPGYVDYGLNHGATHKIDIEQGRFVFFYMQL